ncbi:MAG: SH3 domain-containing protein [Armatimonadota bacterium]
MTALTALVAITTVAPPADAGKVYPAWVIPDTLNVRSGPGTDRELIGALTKGTKVHVTAFSNNWCWAKLPDGRWGWIAEWLLQFSADKGRALAAQAGNSGSSSSTSSSASSHPPAWIKSATINVRSGPGTHYEKRGQLTRGTKVFIIKRDRGWSQCRTPGGYGWIRDDLLERDLEAGRGLAGGQGGSSSQSSSNRKGFVDGDGVRLRSGPGTNHSIKASLTKGQTVFVSEKRGDWLSVQVHGGNSGWIHADLVKYDPGTSSSQTASSSTSSSATAAASTDVRLKGFVNGSRVHLRSGPSLNDHIRAKVVKGQTLYITKRSGDWYYGNVHGGENGWIHTSLVKLAGEDDTGESPTAKAFVAGSRVNLRAGPSTSERSKALVIEGQTLYVTDRQGDWYRVRVHGGEDGWIHSSLVKLPGDAGSGTAGPTPSVSPTPTPPSTPSTPAVGRTVEDLTAWIGEDRVNVRYGPGTDHDIKMKLGQGEKVQVLELSGHWCKIKDSDGNTGWVAGWVMNFKGPGQDPTAIEGDQEVNVRTAWVARPEVNLRAGPGTDHEQIAQAVLGTEVIILDREGDWYRVVLDNGKTGYMASWLLDTRAQRRVRQGEEQSAPPSPAGFGQSVVATAKKFIGSRYVRGGASPAGFDCSGFVHYVLAQHGVNVSRSSRTQFSQGTPVSRNDLQIGDVVFFKNTYRSGISHVGIYVGGNQFIHAANSRTNVRISDLNSAYYAPRYAGARRMR